MDGLDECTDENAQAEIIEMYLIFLNVEVVDNCYPYGHPRTLFRHLSARLAIPWATLICLECLIWTRATVVCITVFPTRCSLCSYHESDSVENSSIYTVSSFLYYVLWFSGCRRAFKYCHCLWYTQDLRVYVKRYLSPSTCRHRLCLQGVFRLNSFYDFLRDLARSSIFSVNAPAFQIKFFERLIQQHHRCASSYAIDGSSLCFPALCLLLNLLVMSELVLAPGIVNLMAWLSHNSPSFFQVCGHAPLHSLRQLAELDYRKSLVLQMTWLELHSPARSRRTRFSGKHQKIVPTVFLYVRTDKLQNLVPAFLSVCFMLECYRLIFKHY